MLALFVSPAIFGVCNGAIWFEGYNPQEPQEIRLNMQHIEKPVENTTSLPVCDLILNETEPHIVNLTIIASTAALFYQTGNFETWLSIDSQEPEKLIGILDSQGSAAGELYNRQYNVTLSGLGDGAHSIKIQVAGDYYGPGPEGGNYDCEGNATIIINHQTEPSPTSFPTLPVAAVSVVAVALAIAGLLVCFKKHKHRLVKKP